MGGRERERDRERERERGRGDLQIVYDLIAKSEGEKNGTKSSVLSNIGKKICCVAEVRIRRESSFLQR